MSDTFDCPKCGGSGEVSITLVGQNNGYEYDAEGPCQDCYDHPGSGIAACEACNREPATVQLDDGSLCCAGCGKAEAEGPATGQIEQPHLGGSSQRIGSVAGSASREAA